MSSPRLPILKTISQAWIDAARAIRAMPLVTACALVIYALIAVGVFFAVEALLLNSGRSLAQWLASPAWFVFSVFDGSMRIILLAPLAIAVHRFVIRGEVARGYPLHPLRPSYLRYVGTIQALFLAYRAPDLISLLLPGNLPFAANIGIFVLTVALMLTVVIVALRRITLFAAIAVYAPNATWRETAPLDAGNLVRSALILCGVIIPGVVAGVLLHVYLPTPDWPNGTGLLVLSFASSLLQLAMICALAAAVSRIYQTTGAPAVSPPVPSAP
jgi:hypothetical protein